MLLLNKQSLSQCFNPETLREQMEQALIAVSTKQASHFPRTAFSLPLNHSSVLGFMPAVNAEQSLLGYKVITVMPSIKQVNPHQGQVVLLDCDSGQILSILDACYITAKRTAAVSAIATNALSCREAYRLALVGAGTQALEHLHALLRIRPISQVSLYARSQTSFDTFVAASRELAISIDWARSAKDAVADADIVVTCTASSSALFSIDDCKAGAHINAIGACRPGEQEISFCGARHPFLFFVDSINACLEESDEANEVVKSNKLGHELIEIGTCLGPSAQQHPIDGATTVFKSVGLGVEDLYAANCFYQYAIKNRIGQDISWP